MANYTFTSNTNSVLVDIDGKQAAFGDKELHPYTPDRSGDIVYLYDTTGILKKVGSIQEGIKDYSKDRILLNISFDTIDVNGINTWANAGALLDALRAIFFLASADSPLIPDSQRVDTFANLPDPVLSDGQYWIVDQATGTWILGTRREAGVYKAVASSWTYRGADVPYYLLDDQFTIKDGFDNSKQLGFEVNLITPGQRRIATWPDKNGTVVLTDDLQDFFNKSTDDASDIAMANSSQTVQNKIVNIQNEVDTNTEICTSAASFISTVTQNVGTQSNPAGTNIQINLTNILGPNNLSFTLSSGSVSVPVAGWYKVSLKGCARTSSNNRQNTAFVVKRNLVDIVGTFTAGYMRNPANNDASPSAANIIPQFQFAVNDTIGLYAIVQGDGGQSTQTVAQECVLTLEYIGA